MSLKLDVRWIRESFPQLSDIEMLATGGQKWVLRCRHPQNDWCVLKLLQPGRSERLDREFEAIHRLNNVPRVYDVGYLPSSIGDLVWFLEEYVDGISLSERITHGPLGKSEILRLAHDLLLAAAGAEAENVVHRDIKPDNIKIDRTGRAWLLDYGIARILDLESLTRTDATTGPHTPGYSAPEQFNYKKRSIDGRTDLFAIGIVLYECAIGSNPFLVGARDRLEVLRRVENMQLPRLKLDWDQDGRFADFISALTQKYPHQRPISCFDALEWFLEQFTE